MEEITFSVFNHGPSALENLQVLLQQFELQHGIHARLEVIPSWAVGWSRLVEVALYHGGPDISEVGNSWVGDLVRMEALRPFMSKEIDVITGEMRFFDTVWQSSIRYEHGIPIVYSIPFASDVRAVFYRRDLLDKAGIDESTAFNGTAQFEVTMETLKKKGVPMPLALPTRRSRMTIHNVASWVWGAGGDFLTREDARLAFDQPQALEGFKTFFRLGRYLSPEIHDIEESEADKTFWSGKAAVILSGSWMISIETMTTGVRNNLGVAPMLGVPFVGGSHLVVWNHSRHEQSAIGLIHFLRTEEARKLLYPQFGLPISESDWTHPPFDSELYQGFKASILKGRGFPTGQLWGLVEKRLSDALSDIWGKVLNEPESLTDEIVETQIKDLAHRLQLTLES